MERDGVLFAKDEMAVVLSSEEALRREYQAEIGRLRESFESLLTERDKLARSMLLIHTWLGRAMDHKTYRGDMVDAEGLVEDAYNEASERVKLDV